MTSVCSGSSDPTGFPLQLLFQELDDLLPSFRRLLMPDVVAKQFPSFRMTEFGVDLLQLRVDQIQAFDRRQLVLQTRQPEMGPRRDQRVDLSGRKPLEQAWDEVIHAMR
jgi:hypothetical protein